MFVEIALSIMFEVLIEFKQSSVVFINIFFIMFYIYLTVIFEGKASKYEIYNKQYLLIEYYITS